MNSQDYRNLQEAYLDVYEQEEEVLDEAITSEKGKAKAKEMIASRTTPSGRAKSGQGASVAAIKHIGRSNREGLSGTPMTPTMAKNPVKSASYGGTGNKAARRAGTYSRFGYKESYDLYDIILSHLIDEGYADTEEAAERIMVNMSEEWRESIVEARVDAGKTDDQKIDARNRRRDGDEYVDSAKFSPLPGVRGDSESDREIDHLSSRGKKKPVASSPTRQTKRFVEARMDPRGRPASGPMNVYANPKGKPSQAHLDAVKSYDAEQKKKTPEQRKAEQDAYRERQMNNK